MYQATSQDCFNTEENSFTVNYTKDDLIFGKFLYWDTAATQSSNTSAADGAAKHYYTTLILQEKEIKDITLTDEASGISVTASNLIIPEDSKLVVEVPNDAAIGSAGVALGEEYDSSLFAAMKK